MRPLSDGLDRETNTEVTLSQKLRDSNVTRVMVAAFAVLLLNACRNKDVAQANSNAPLFKQVDDYPTYPIDENKGVPPQEETEEIPPVRNIYISHRAEPETIPPVQSISISHRETPEAIPPVEKQNVAPPKAPDPVATTERTYVVSEHAISLTTTFSVEKSGKNVGEVVKKIISMSPSYTYSDANGHCLAKGRRAIFSWGNEVDVNDCDGHQMAKIKENIIEGILGFGIKTSYRIIDSSGQAVATSEKTDFMSTNFDVSNKDGTTAMHAERPMINMGGDTWTMTVSRSPVDDRVFVLLVAFKTDADNELEESQSKKSNGESSGSLFDDN